MQNSVLHTIGSNTEEFQLQVQTFRDTNDQAALKENDFHKNQHRGKYIVNNQHSCNVLKIGFAYTDMQK